MVEPRKSRVAGVCGTLKSEKGKETSGLVLQRPLSTLALLPWSVEKLGNIAWVSCI